jgi:hypothetical protein
MCQEHEHWTEALTLVLLGIRTAFKYDLQASVAELIYGEPLRIPGVLLTPTINPVDPAHLITELRKLMARLRTVPAARHTSPATLVHNSLEKCTHISLPQDALRKALEPPYSSQYRILSRKEKTLKILVSSRPVTVSTDRDKPAYIPNETNRSATTNYKHAVSTNPVAERRAAPPTPIAGTTRSGPHVHFLARFNS